MEKQPVNYAYLSGTLEGIIRTLVWEYDKIPKDYDTRVEYFENLINKAKEFERSYTTK